MGVVELLLAHEGIEAALDLPNGMGLTPVWLAAGYGEQPPAPPRPHANPKLNSIPAHPAKPKATCPSSTRCSRGVARR